ncbi:MAG: IMP dehydrogenase [Candidatus Cloacimonetes bacterium]|nr:IMP dehydrogenase [Candidatus Cloacimonadota bacterium]
MKKSIRKTYTFDDVLLAPQHSKVLPSQVEISTRITKNITLKIPVLSAAMDTVTESGLAIAIAREGGIGIIHKNLSIEAQANEVRLVKRAESGVITSPYTISPDDHLKKVMELKKQHRIGGFPVVKDGKLVGILTNRDIRFESNLNRKVKDLMTPQDKLIVCPTGTSMAKAQELLQKNRIEKLLIVDENFTLTGMITVKDIMKSIDYPHAVQDSNNRLLVGAAVGVTGDFLERAQELVHLGADLIVIDTAHGHHKNILTAIKSIKKSLLCEILAGNIATLKAARYLIDAGASAIKVGIGPGSICTTRVIAGIGVPQLTAIMDCAEVAAREGIPIIADGGIKFSGDIVKALAGGADAVMIGSLFAGTDESPGEFIIYNGRRFKSYRGMGSISAMKQGSSDRYFQNAEEDKKLVAEGIEGMVPYKGPLKDFLFQLIGGLRAGMGYCGAGTLSELRENAEFIEITPAGLKESHPHDIRITKETPNYYSSD